MEQNNATNVASELESKTDEYGRLSDDDRVTISVEYESRRSGNTLTKEGEVWAVDEGKWGETLLRFSQNAGETDENPYFVKIYDNGAELISVTELGNESELGDIGNVEVDGLDSDDDTDDMDESVDDVMSVFDEPDEISEGMELTEDGETVYLIKSIRGNDATVAIWKDGRRKRKQRMDADSLQCDYESGTLTVA